MDITISSRNVVLSDSLVSATKRKVNRLGRFDRAALRADVHFSHEPTRSTADCEVCEVVLAGADHRLHSRAAAGDGFTAVDRAVAKLQQQLDRVKARSTLR
ncbi:MAG: ribosome-associated translation inhibitor RaiA [Acidimicrobiales bacterium]